MNDEFFVWAAKIEPDATVLVQMEGFKKSYELDIGTRQGKKYPPDVTLYMDSRKPTHHLLLDSVKNVEGVIIISEKMKVFMEKQNLTDVEFLPITVDYL